MKNDLLAALGMAAAIVGAGFASGRELVTFFAGMGAYSWLGVAAASAGIGFLTYVIMRLARHTGAESFAGIYGRLMGSACHHTMQMLFGLLIAFTGAAMLAAGGELGALALPIHGSYATGLILTLIPAAIAASSGGRRLSTLGALLVPAVVIYYLSISLTGERYPVVTDIYYLPMTLPMGLLYAAFNSALAAGAACLYGKKVASPRRAGLMTGAIMLIMLIPANAALLGAGEDVRSMALPSVVLAARWGVTGYYISILIMWLAVVSTLCALISSGVELLSPMGSLGRTRALILTCAAMVVFSIYGFELIVNAVYPAMGWICAIALVVLPIFLPKNEPV